MKTKKNAVTAALKTTDKKTTSNAPASTATTMAPETPKAPLAATKLAPVTPKTPLTATKMASETPKAPAEALTTIEVKADVGFGNAVFLRGTGSGLTWEHGVPLVCVDGCTWRWSQKVADPVTFKVLLNDRVWSAGKDLVVAPGQKLEVSPSFS